MAELLTSPDAWYGLDLHLFDAASSRLYAVHDQKDAHWLSFPLLHQSRSHPRLKELEMATIERDFAVLRIGQSHLDDALAGAYTLTDQRRKASVGGAGACA